MGLFDRAYPEAALRQELARQQFENMKRQRGLLDAAPYRARLLLGDMQMQDQPTPKFMDVRGAMSQRGIDPGATGGMPQQAPQIGLGRMGQARQMMGMGADPMAVAQSFAPKAPTFQKFSPGEKGGMVDASGKFTETVSPSFAPQKPNEPPTSAQEYGIAKQQGYPGSFMQFITDKARAGATNVNVDNREKGLETAFAPALSQAYEKAAAAQETLVNTKQIKSLVDQGIITGTGADVRLGFAKALATAGLTDGEDVANTETFITQMGRNVLNLVKGLGAGSGISNADLKFAERVAAGDITLNEGTIRRVLDIQERASKSHIAGYNKRFGSFFNSPEYSDAIKEPYRIDLPKDEPTEPVKAPGQNPNLQAVVDELRKRGVVK